MLESICVLISEEIHIAEAQRDALLLAQQVGFGRADAYYLATAVSELATNIIYHADSGEIRLNALTREDAVGVEVIAADAGPGIANIEQAMREGFSTSGSLGCGLPGVSRLMDTLEICSDPGRGTRVYACKWVDFAHRSRSTDHPLVAPC
jgi:serine/threonine-protein kinase RsbT